MHRKHTLGRQEIVECGEDRLLDLAGVAGSADDHDPAAEVDQDEGFAVRAITLRLGHHRRQRHDREVRLEVHQLVRGRPDEQVASEKAVPRELRDDPHPQPKARVRARKHVLRVDVVGVAELFHPRQQLVELR